ncbi:hypothetical protein DPMN_164324 [Dreissena polymorpha]|uniref:Uncharacterized protein n=1 Tax=Dreissena polymorpha TaxID=45954 RepID=A0A9D4ESR1_DREPO|nr:hypothetical protein DPMN_164324 [Dreissena polymorpha]
MRAAGMPVCECQRLVKYIQPVIQPVCESQRLVPTQLVCESQRLVPLSRYASPNG